MFNYEQMKQMNGGKQMKDVWEGSLTRPSEKWAGRHPTQKPEYLLERIILASTKRGTWYWIRFAVPGQPGWCPESTEGSYRN